MKHMGPKTDAHSKYGTCDYNDATYGDVRDNTRDNGSHLLKRRALLLVKTKRGDGLHHGKHLHGYDTEPFRADDGGRSIYSPTLQ